MGVALTAVTPSSGAGVATCEFGNDRSLKKFWGGVSYENLPPSRNLVEFASGRCRRGLPRFMVLHLAFTQRRAGEATVAWVSHMPATRPERLRSGKSVPIP